MKRSSFLFVFILSHAVAGAQTAAVNNGLIRSGNGTENSVNIRGNLQQPFYKDNGNWYKLTYANYALDAAFALGGSGADEWNLEGTLLLNPVPTNHVINASAFNFSAGSSEPGTGTLVSTGDLSFGANGALQVEHTYTLEPGDPFIKIGVKLTNIGSSTAENVRMWIGTRDDWVGSTDRPLKEKGNLVGNSFAPATSASQRASTVRITSLDEGVLFHADTEKANAVLNHCCSFFNIMNQNPSTSALTHSSDGSYGFYVRLDDLPPGESGSFTWYYAAGTIDELDDIAQEVIQASAAISEITCSSAKLTATASEDVTGRYMAVPAASQVPLPADIVAGIDYAGVTVADTGSAQMSGGAAHTFDIEGLESGAPYTVYFIGVKPNGDYSDVISYGLTTAAPAVLSFTVTDTDNCGETGTGTLTAAVTGGIGPFTYAWESGEETAGVTGKTVGYHQVEVFDAGGCPSVVDSAFVGAEDHVDPEIAGKSFEIALDENGTVQIVPDEIAALTDNGSTDNCGLDPEGYALSKTHFTCDDLGDHTVVYTITDYAGNTADTAITVTVQDITPPQVAVQDVTLVLDSNGTATLDPETADAGSFDNCGITAKSLDVYIFTCADLGENLVTLTLTDASNNTAEAQFYVTVTDQSAPEISFTADPVLYLNEDGTVSPTVTELISNVWDNCGTATVGFNKTVYDCSDIGPQTLICYAEDGSGNLTTAEAQVLIADTVKPDFFLPAVTLTADENGAAHLSEEMLLPYAADNCGIAGLTVQDTLFYCHSEGFTQTTVTVFDLNGNHIQRKLRVNITDVTPPRINAQTVTLYTDEAGTALLSPEKIDYEATDNCGIASATVLPTRFDCSDIGAQTAVLTVKDYAGNEATTTFTVIVKDTLAPVFEAPGSLEFCEGEIHFAGLFRAHDNCAAKIRQVLGPTSGSYLAAGTYPVAFSATDLSGNSSDITAFITVSPSPTLSAPATFSATAGIPTEISVETPDDSEIYWSDGTRGPTAFFNLQTDATVTATAVNRDGCETSRTIRVDVTETGESEIGKEVLSMKIYPNPTRGILNVEPGAWGDNTHYDITVTDLHGRPLLRDRIHRGVSLKQLYLNELAQGFYLISLENESERITRKFNKL